MASRESYEFDEKTVDVDSLDKSQCLRFLHQVQDGMAEIDLQIEIHNDRPREDRTPRARQWYHSAVIARKHKATLRQKVQTRLGFFKQAQKEANLERSRAFERQFVDAARRRLPQDLFAEICAEATAREPGATPH